MQIRKLVKSGNTSLVTALPKDWLTSNKLKGGDQVFIDQVDEKLIITPTLNREKPAKTQIVLNIDKRNSRTIYRDINSAYLHNYDLITIKGKNLKQNTKTIKKTIQNLVALELVEETSDKIIAKNFLNFEDIGIHVLIRRIDNIIRSMIVDLKNSFKNPELAHEIIERDNEINRLNFLILKIVKVANKNKAIRISLKTTSTELQKLWDLNLHLEKIGDRIKSIARTTKDLKETPSMKKLILDIEELYLLAMNSFYKSSITLSDTVWEKKLVLLEKLEKKIETETKHTIININTFNLIGYINDIGRIVRYNEEVKEI